MNDNQNNGLTYVLNLDSRCNQHCLFCMKKDMIEENRKLTYKMVCEEIIEAKRKGFRKIDFYGGEPLTYSFLIKAIKFANALGLSCFLATNATKFYSYKYTQLFFSNVRPKEIRTALHSYKSSVHDKVTQIKGSFKKTKQGIKNILKYKKTKLWVNVVITSLNYKDLLEITDSLYKWGVRNIVFSGLVIEGRILDNISLAVDLSYVQPYLLKAIQLCDKLGFEFRIVKLPACIFSGINLKSYQIVQEIGNNNFIKPSSCHHCTYGTICNGLEKHLLMIFGMPSFYSKN